MPRKMIMAGFAGLVAAVGNDALQAFEFNAEGVNARGGLLGGRHLETVPLDQAIVYLNHSAVRTA